MKYVSQQEFSQKHGFLFFNIPKNGGTSFLKAIDGENSFVPHHHTAQVAKYYLGAEKIEKIFKIAIIRNPIDRFISTYKYVRLQKSYWHEVGTSTEHSDYQLLKNKTLDKAVLLLIYHHMKDPWHWRKRVDFIKIQNNYCVNALATQEHLASDINYIMSKIGKPELNLPVINQSESASEGTLTLSQKSLDTLLDFYYEDYLLWQNIISNRTKWQDSSS